MLNRCMRFISRQTPPDLSQLLKASSLNCEILQIHLAAFGKDFPLFKQRTVTFSKYKKISENVNAVEQIIKCTEQYAVCT